MRKVAIFALVMVALLSVLPMAPVAAAGGPKPSGASEKQFSATLSIDYILDGTVRPVGQYPDGNFQWQVTDRPTYGTVTNSPFDGSYQLVYSGTLNPDQSGKVHGVMNFFTATGTISAQMTAEVGATAPVGLVFRGDGPHVVLKASLSDARFAFSSGTGAYADIGGTGTFDGSAFLILDSTATHVIGLAHGEELVFDINTFAPLGFLASQINMTGKVTGI